MPINRLEVCFTPGLYQHRDIQNNFIVVVVDILRAGTSMCSAFANGVKKIIPVDDLEKAQKFKSLGYLVAGERDGLKLDFADFGNSPYEFKRETIDGETLVYTTTNGTRSIDMAKSTDSLVIGSFTNIRYVSNWLISQKKSVVILCSGWKNTFSLEDAVYSGALVEKLTNDSNYGITGDSVFAALNLWKSAKDNLESFLRMGSHYERLRRIGAEKDLEFAIQLNTTPVIPVLEKDHLINKLV